MIIRAPFRTLTVTEGRNTIGFINEMGRQRFKALDITDGLVGIFGSRGEAAKAIADHRNAEREVK